MRFIVRHVLGLTGALILTAAVASAQEEKAGPPEKVDATALAKQTQNPVADLVSIPFQFNFNSGGGLGDGTLYNLNIQPVIPITLNEDWKLIARAIVPYISSPAPDGGQEGGFGDIQLQSYFTQAHSGKVIWGIGPLFSFPAATNPLVRTGSWAAGPAAVVLTMPGHWVIGGLVNQLWTYADNGGEPEVNQFVVQPFINYNFGVGWALSTGPLITANWNAPSGQEWTVPIGLGITKTTVFNRRPMNIGLQYYHNVVHPDGGPSDQVRIILALLYPTARRPEGKT
ncbi:MAG TPA: neuromedin U [Candidatus Limnocylindria bacterium]|nr:neuromedin U [Candidatus Limnocylindria bacterium]